MSLPTVIVPGATVVAATAENPPNREVTASVTAHMRDKGEECFFMAGPWMSRGVRRISKGDLLSCAASLLGRCTMHNEPGDRAEQNFCPIHEIVCLSEFFRVMANATAAWNKDHRRGADASQHLCIVACSRNHPQNW